MRILSPRPYRVYQRGFAARIAVSSEKPLTECDIILVDTVSGNIKAAGEFTELESDSVSGDITVSSAVPLEKLDCDSTSGNIRLTIPKDSGFTLKADTVSGDISCGLPTVSESKNRRVCGDGSADFETDTVSGDLIITSAE